MGEWTGLGSDLLVYSATRYYDVTALMHQQSRICVYSLTPSHTHSGSGSGYIVKKDKLT